MLHCHPVDDFKPAIHMLDKGRAAFDPITVIGIGDTVDIFQGCRMDMATDHTIEVAGTCFINNRIFKMRDEVDSILHLVFQIGR